MLLLRLLLLRLLLLLLFRRVVLHSGQRRRGEDLVRLENIVLVKPISLFPCYQSHITVLSREKHRSNKTMYTG